MTRAFQRATNWIVDWPAITVLIIVLLTAASITGYVAPEKILDWIRPELDDQQEQRVAVDRDSDDEQPPDVNPFSISNANAILVAESSQFFTPDGSRMLRNVVEKLESLPYVSSVVWMDRVPPSNIFGLPEPLVPNATASQARFDNAREKALANPLVRGQFLSQDGSTTVMLLRYDFFYVESNEDCVSGIRKVAEAAAAEVSNTDVEFSVTGRTPLYIAARQQYNRSAAYYQMVGYTVIFIMALILFRGFSAVLIVAVAPALGVFWTLGLLPYFDLQDNPFKEVLLPVLISLVGLTDGVHLMVHIRRLRADGLSTLDAARQGVHEVGLACGLTSLTTAIGFGSLVLATHEIVREFGWCCVIGVTMTFISVITTIPLLCSSWLGRNVHKGLDKSLIDKNLTKIGGLVDWVMDRTTLISRLGIAITVILALVSLTLKPDERRTEGMPSRAEPVIALGKVDKAMGGLEFGYVNVNWDKSIQSDSPDVLRVVREVDELLQSEELIGHPLSIRNLIESLPGGGEGGNRMAMLDLLPPPLKRAFYTPEHRTASVSFRVQDIGIAKYGPVFERLQVGLEEIADRNDGFNVELEESGAVWRFTNLYVIVVDFLRSLTSAAFIIFIVLSFAYRSLRVGLISIIPNLFPLVLSGAFLVVTGQYLEMVTVCTFIVCLGIAVDDTIHFLTRYQEERRKTDDEQEAIRKAFTGVGTALIMTTVVLLAGFATVLFSENRENRIFGWMGSITIAAALFGDLTFLPALLSRFDGKPKSEPEREKAEVAK